MTFVPKFNLYANDGVSLLYTFIAVQETNAPQSPMRYIEIEGQRGTGSLILEGGTKSWDLYIKGILYITNNTQGYSDLIGLVDALESTVALNTEYYLKIDKTGSTTYSYKVKRLEPIEYTPNLRTDYIEYNVKLRVNSWS